MGIILKDWYGKDKVYDYDQLWVRDTEGGLVPFTKGLKPTLGTLEVTENGTYNATNVTGYDRVVVDVGPEVNEMLFNKTDFTGFAANESLGGLYTKTLSFGTDIETLKIIVGREYTISWDDVMYTLIAKDTYRIFEEVDNGETLYRDMYYLGNGALLGYDDLEDTGEPFVMLYTSSKDLTLISTDTTESHNVAIMKRVRPQDGLDMMLQSITVEENGEYVADPFYDGISKVVVNVDPTKVSIMKETTLNKSELNSTFGYLVSITPTPFTLTLGQKYFVSWDGTVFECTAYDGSAAIPGTIYLGNASSFGLPGNMEPFVIGVTSSDDGDVCTIFCGTDTEPTVHKVGIWQKVSGGSGGGKGSPFFKMVGVTTTNTNNTSVDTTQTLNIPKGAKIIRAWKNAVYNIKKTYYSNISSVNSVSVDSLVIDTSNANYDTVSYTHKSGLGSNASYNTFEFRVLISTDIITVTDAGDGFGVGTVNRDEPLYCSGSDRGVEQSMYLKTLELAEGVTGVPKYACYNQIFLESANLPNAETIGSNAFYKCESLGVILGNLDNLGSIGSSAFAYCKSLKSFPLGPNITTLENFTFQFCEALETISLDNVTSIGSSAFNGCTALESISLSPNLTSLGNSAFSGCTSLTGELIIPDAITEIPMSAFANTKFDRVVFPANLSSVGSSAFSGCTHPTEFDFSACTTIPSLAYSSASNLGTTGNGQVLKIPSALFDSWSTKAGWKDWAAQMVAV